MKKTLDKEIVNILLHYKKAKGIDNATHPCLEDKYMEQILSTCAKHFLGEIEGKRYIVVNVFGDKVKSE